MTVSPRKQLGQHFLADENILGVIGRLAELDEHDVVLEVGPGLGVLTAFLAARVALERRYYVSFAGNVSYPKAGDLRACAAEVPADRILAETDSPYLAPQARRGRPNEPANVVLTVAALADARGDDPRELAARIDANASAAFRLP